MTEALVLGGGGVSGIAWLTGLLTGLADAEQDVTKADVIVGTSAGATVGPSSGVALAWKSCTPGRPSPGCKPLRSWSTWTWRASPRSSPL